MLHSIDKGLFTNHYACTEYKVLKGLLANVLRWYAKLLSSDDKLLVNQHPLFAWVLSVFNYHGVEESEVKDYSSFIHQDYLSEVETFSIDDPTELISKVECLTAEVCTLRHENKEQKELIREKRDLEKENNRLLNIIANHMMLNSVEFEDLSPMSSICSSIKALKPKKARTSRLEIIPPCYTYFKDKVGALTLKSALSNYLTQN